MVGDDVDHVEGKGEKRHRRHRHKDRNKKHEGPSVIDGSGRIEDDGDAEDWDANRTRIEHLCQTYPNNVCSDCSRSGTRWASVNHGVFICIRCSGIHRSMGVHVSRIKSTNMDKWTTAEVNLMESIGNQRGKLLYESRLPKETKTTAFADSDAALATFIRQKYQKREFASDDVAEKLKHFYKQARYRKKPKNDSKRSVSPERGAVRDRSAEARQREETVKALYGPNAEVLSKKESKTKPLRGTFGLVNVAADCYDKRRQAILAHFNFC
ncbi:putative GTPase activating protein for Arf [Trypanosoma vivax]|uniref:Putative ADP-ribosylation factor GTPase activating protein n=1 Tax=Trypanosoma vivax (strain Y486) TaxID=1055687 RepID=G0TTL9_TRYVY|nr:putative ADP-ribosylation factor GTPase activating protein [Trypanosoma vivax]KAH8607008.1 putative GTPase activating protein for Arf [Trypanosoma vivax]CCC47300.1 putative ADP-ribosylation factor GTPase activating protein [Trypanosoma vivax Y486]